MLYSEGRPVVAKKVTANRVIWAFQRTSFIEVNEQTLNLIRNHSYTDYDLRGTKASVAL